MGILKLDLFSSEFYFNVGQNNYKRGTILGFLLSILSVSIVASYFIYLLILYINNQISPKFRSQSFLTEDRMEIPLEEDLVGFRFMYNYSTTLEQYQAAQNLTYLVYVVQLFYKDSKNQIYKTIDLDTYECATPQLKGFICIDFSKVSNYTLILDNTNGSQIYSTVFINLYGCRDLDTVKKTIPSNCAPQTDIDQAVDGIEAYFWLKLKTQQYNTTSQQIQTNYRNQYNFVLSNQFNLNALSAQKQVTQVEKGLLFLQNEVYSSPISYASQAQSLDRNQALLTGMGPYSKQALQMDEVVQQFQIQFPSFSEILALVNGIAGLLIFFRVLGRYYSKYLIQQDLFMLIFNNLYQDQYQNLLCLNKLFQGQQNSQGLHTNLNYETVDEILENKIEKDIFIPNFSSKLKTYVESTQSPNYSSFSPKLSDQQQINNSYQFTNFLSLEGKSPNNVQKSDMGITYFKDETNKFQKEKINESKLDSQQIDILTQRKLNNQNQLYYFFLIIFFFNNYFQIIKKN